jgi:hypothetical protein
MPFKVMIPSNVRGLAKLPKAPSAEIMGKRLISKAIRQASLIFAAPSTWRAGKKRWIRRIPSLPKAA